MSFLAEQRIANSREGELVRVELLGGDDYRSALMMRRPAAASGAAEGAELYRGPYEWYVEVRYRTAEPPADYGPDEFEASERGWVRRGGYELDATEARRAERLVEDALATERRRRPGGGVQLATCGRDDFCNRLSTRRSVGVVVDLGQTIDVSTDQLVEAVMRGRADLLQQLLTTVELDPAVERTDPTPAHRALARLAPMHGLHCMTRARDALLEAAGAMPWRLTSPARVDRAVSSIGPTLLCCGGERDDSTVVQRFREVHPTGLVMVVAATCPTYLEPGDLFLRGDPQETMVYCASRLVGRAATHAG